MASKIHLRTTLKDVLTEWREHYGNGKRACIVSRLGLIFMAKNRAGDKVRLDKLLVDRGIVETRSKAQAHIMAGEVRVDLVKS